MRSAHVRCLPSARSLIHAAVTVGAAATVGVASLAMSSLGNPAAAASTATHAASSNSVPAVKRLPVKVAHLDLGDAHLLVDINRMRSRAGLRPLRFNGRLSAVAQAWSSTLASRNRLAHNPHLMAQVSRAVPTWEVVAENVGLASNRPAVTAADKVFDGYMSSPLHRANLMNPAITLIGLGTTRSRTGIDYNVVDLAGN